MSSHKFWVIVATATLFIAGCADKTPTVTYVTKAPVKETNTAKVPVPQKVHERTGLKEVQDNNFSSAYMYPEDNVKKEEVVKVAEAQSIVNGMSKEECISMIGKEKFSQYADMFGDETSSIKRCAMIKSMR